ncbi:sulfotransferase [Aliiroseovarius sp. F20344]|uniref:sulfotransferase family protein n=1 Tax=Aliiroseovarius sp. F20344 TaxID=2926414 RepID=UPI001FF156BD|nr:sulfotransferase [Aliiroseovarius sp. F20344]MCK0141076.1 sulfotransferase domain-containing protein [Aliiroseovarius sp. F20344]
MHFSDIDFVIIGAAKSATTWLQQQLQADPAVHMPDPELHYFSREYSRGQDWYFSQFNEELSDRIVGEKSNSYLYEPDSAMRLHNDMPHVKLIAQLRNPVERAYSSYCMRFRRGEVGPDIESYLDPTLGENLKYLISGKFASHLQTYIDLYGRDKLLILFFEGVAQDPEGQMSQVRSHIGLPQRSISSIGRAKVKDKKSPTVSPKLRKSLAWLKPIVRPLRGTSGFEAIRGMVTREIQYPQLTDELRNRLNDYYHPSIEALEKMSGQSLSHWYDS